MGVDFKKREEGPMKKALFFLVICVILVGISGCHTGGMEKLTEAQKVRLKQLETNYTAGKINQADYDVEKAAIFGGT